MNIAKLNLLKDRLVENYDELQEWKAYNKRVAKDTANKSLWGTITGIVSAATTFIATGNPSYAKAAYHAGNRFGREVTEYTGYEPGYDAPDIKGGKFDVAVNDSVIDAEEKRLGLEQTAEVVGLGSDLFSIATSYYGGKEFSVEQKLNDLEEAGDSFASISGTEGWEVSPIVAGDEIIDYQVLNEAGVEVTSQELAGMGLDISKTGDLIGEQGMWDSIQLSSGRFFDPVTQEVITPNIFTSEGELYRRALLQELMPGNEKNNKMLYELINQKMGI